MTSKKSSIHEPVYIKNDKYVCKNCGEVLQDPEWPGGHRDVWNDECKKNKKS